MSPETIPAPVETLEKFRTSPHAAFTTLIDTWTAQKNGEKAPTAEQFDLISLTGLLNQVLVLELVSDRRVRYHFTGPRISDVFEVDPTGHLMEDHLPKHTADMMGKLLDAATSHPAGAHLHYRSSYISGRSSENELLLLPLLSESGAHHRMIAYQTFGTALYRDEPRNSTNIGHDLFQGTWVDLGAGAPEQPIQIAA